MIIKFRWTNEDPVQLGMVEDYVASLESGLHTITYLVGDCAGNVATSSYTVEVKESGVPVISCPANTTVALPLGACSSAYSLPLAASVSDNCNLADTFEYMVSGATSLDTTSFNAAEAPMTILNKGTNTVTYIVYDRSGNSASCSFEVVVEDIEAPSIVCRVNSVLQAHPSGILPLIINSEDVVFSATDKL